MEQACGTSTPNNTNGRVPSNKTRAYFITFWKQDYPRELPKNMKYLITCEDETEDGKWHGHAFMYFKNPVCMSSVKKLFGNDCHLKKPYNNSGCIKYVKGEIKDERKVKHNILEYGDAPNDNGIHNIKDLDEIENAEDVPVMMYNIWKKRKTEPKKIKKSEWSKDVKVIYIWGPSGVGKSTKAQELADDEFEEIKYVNGFYIGVVDGTGCAIYDDFRDSHMPASEFINFIDYRTHNLNVKGGQVKNKYSKIIITSIIPLHELYRRITQEQKEQWIRRIEEIPICDPDALA